MKTVNIDSDYIHDVYKHYEASDLVSHPAIIYLPYSVMSIKLKEMYSLAIPLFMPSPIFFLNNGGLGKDKFQILAEAHHNVFPVYKKY